jgi:hypothetical protein
VAAANRWEDLSRHVTAFAGEGVPVP